MEKLLKKVLPVLLLCCVSCMVGVHHRVIVALIKGEPMPKAPKWHFWVKNR